MMVDDHILFIHYTVDYDTRVYFNVSSKSQGNYYIM